jgi:hypothetical protein
MADIRKIATQFTNRTLPKEEWTHTAHIAVAFAELEILKDFENTLHGLRRKIKEYNLSVGTENTNNSGYHETLTIFWLTVLNEFYSLNRQFNLEELFNRFVKTICATSKFPTLFYSRELLFSTHARLNWVNPDLLPLTDINKILSQNMEQHFILTDKEFADQFADSSLDPTLFSHEAHLRLAWIHISKYDDVKAIENITEQLQNFVRHLGATDKYNATLTVAAIKAVKHFMQKEPLETFYDFITTYPRLKTNFKNIIEQHYGFDIFNSTKAKEKYLDPDLLEFT